jgi:peptidoglycan/LPS O-acetylase OafA/YrhL
LGISAILTPILFPLTESRFSYTIGFTVLYLGFGAILLLSLFSRSAAREWITRRCAFVLVPIGRCSYSIYLWHVMMYYAAARLFFGTGLTPLSFYMQVFTYFAGSIFVGMLMFRFVEVPALRIRDGVYRRNS